MTEHFVYLISVAGQIKVGHSRQPKDRMKHLQVSHGLPLTLHATYAMSREQAINVERRTHSILIKQRRRGEWFACSAEEGVAAIERAIEANPHPLHSDLSAVVTINVKNVDKPAWEIAKRGAANRGQSMGAYLSETITLYIKHLAALNQTPPLRTKQIPYRPRAPIHNGSTEQPTDSVDGTPAL